MQRRGREVALPGSGGAWGGGDEEGGAEGSGVVAAGAQAASFHQKETLQKGNSVEEFGQRHLLLPRGAAEL